MVVRTHAATRATPATRSLFSAAATLFALAVTPGRAFAPPSRPAAPSALAPLRDVPVPTAAGGATPEELKAAADAAPPPASFFDLQAAAGRAARQAIADGHRLLEVEFPPLPANVLEMDDVSAYDVARANVKLALEFARSFASRGVAVMVPDESELDIMRDDLKDDRPSPGVVLTSLRRGEEGDDRTFKPEDVFLGLLGRGSGGTVRPLADTGMYVVLVASAQELPDVEELYDQIKDAQDDEGNAPVVVFFNLKLDVLRGDLGAPAFPGKDFQVSFKRVRRVCRGVRVPGFS